VVVVALAVLSAPVLLAALVRLMVLLSAAQAAAGRITAQRAEYVPQVQQVELAEQMALLPAKAVMVAVALDPLRVVLELRRILGVLVLDLVTAAAVAGGHLVLLLLVVLVLLAEVAAAAVRRQVTEQLSVLVAPAVSLLPTHPRALRSVSASRYWASAVEIASLALPNGDVAMMPMPAASRPN